MKQYYSERFHWIFRYTNKNFFYIVAKTLCLIVGVPIYAVMFVLEMILTGINMIFSWIPILNVVVMIICKSIIFVIDKTFYICILTDIKKYRNAHKENIEYEVGDVDVLDQSKSDNLEEEASTDNKENSDDVKNES